MYDLEYKKPENIKNNMLELAINNITDQSKLPLPVCNAKFHLVANFTKG